MKTVFLHPVCIVFLFLFVRVQCRCGDALETGQIVRCTSKHTLATAAVNVTSVIRNGAVKIRFVPTGPKEYVRRANVALRCLSDGEEYTKPAVARLGHFRQQKKLKNGHGGAIMYRKNISRVECRSSCCGDELSLKSRVKICKTKKDCTVVKVQGALNQIRCSRPCGTEPPPSVVTTTDPCPTCRCKADKTVVVSDGKGANCPGETSNMCDLEIRVFPITDGTTNVQMTGDAQLGRSVTSSETIPISIPKGGRVRLHLEHSLAAGLFPHGPYGSQYEVRMEEALLKDGVLTAPEIVDLQLKPNDCFAVTPDEEEKFAIEFIFDDDVPDDIREACLAAGARWADIVLKGLPAKTITLGGDREIDDLALQVSFADIDGAGGSIANAIYSGLRGPSDNLLPYFGVVQIDRQNYEDARAMGVRTGSAYTEVLVHEIAHAMGFEDRFWKNVGLISSSGDYTGIHALREFKALLVDSGMSDEVSAVPLQKDGGEGTASNHWEEESLDVELMTGYINAKSGDNRLSKITIGAMDDIGYSVDYDKADNFSLKTFGESKNKEAREDTKNYVVIGDLIVDKDNLQGV
eukprot:Plantae.Rhodophyta-Rhodochaete_pulchella.ctg120.p1 GENE.Plantae.Rhodophyta-Rhodochaete_pulchella.ctg120~~Plantae.Rhodophyta-Rhodochaete_pulchella.ctg120.p1  ORF type:complete len:577 (-),score=95.18 Plantae.Rhodophyta-Rhodochaete_pulchella.ctg120:300-2030(-)